MSIRFNFFLAISFGLHILLIFFLSFTETKNTFSKNFVTSVNLEFSNYQRFDVPPDLNQYKKTDENLGSKKEIFSKKLQTKEEKNFAANKYVSAWQRKIETIGNLNYPDFVDSSAPLKLTLSVTLGKDGALLDYALIKASGNQKLDQIAMEIIEMASPFKQFPEEMSDFAEITIIRDWNFGNQEISKWMFWELIMD